VSCFCGERKVRCKLPVERSVCLKSVRLFEGKQLPSSCDSLKESSCRHHELVSLAIVLEMCLAESTTY
jgi:hypothetical protein